MGKISKIGNNRIRVKAKRIVKAREVKVVESNSNIYIEVLPKFQKDLEAIDINSYFLSFLELGRKLYHENKDNISKIKFTWYGIENTIENRYILKDNPNSYINEHLFEYVNSWSKENHLWYKDNDKRINDYFFIKSTDNLRLENFKEWLENNFVPVDVEVDDGPWFYVNYEKIIDLSIFIYLVTYSIKNMKNDKTKSDNDFITFNDFIETSGSNPSDNDYIELVFDIISMFEMHNVYDLYGHNKLIYIKEEKEEKEENKVIQEGRFEMTTEYKDMYAVIWYVFKLYLVDNFSLHTTDERIIPINFCDHCGTPFIGATKFCNNCSEHRGARRQAKSMNAKFEALNKIQELLANNTFSKNLTTKANKYLGLSRTEMYRAKKSDIDKLLYQLELYLHKQS